METCNPWKLYMKDFQNGMQQLRADNLFHDVVIEVEGKSFPCHRVVLCAFSNYFRGMFYSGMVESNKNTIELQGLDAACTSKVFDYLYGDINIDPDFAEDILAIAVYLQIDCLRITCELKLGSNLDNSNVIRLWNMSSKEYPECTILRNFCEVYMLSNFPEFSKSPEALQMNVKEVTFLLQHDELCAPAEDVVCEFLVQWFHFDIENRKEHLEDLFKCSKFSLLSAGCLTEFIENFQLSREDCLQPYVQDAIVYQSNPTVQLESLNTDMDFRLRSDRETSIVVISFKSTSESGLHIELWQYGLREKQWNKMAALPSYPGIGFSTCTYGESMLFLSGGSTACTFFEFDGLKNKWQRKENLLETRCRHCMIALDDYVYVLGGTTNKRTNEIERYCLDMQRWEKCGSLQMAVDDSSVATANDKIYLFGGFSPDFDILKLVQCYDPTTKTTCVVSVIPNMYDLIDAVGANDSIYIIGRQSGKVMKFTTDDNFEPVINVPKLQESYGIVKHGDSLFLLINEEDEESDDIEDRSITSIVEVNLKTGEKTVNYNPLLNTKFDCHCHKLVTTKKKYTLS